MSNKDKNIYLWTPAGWQHLETGEMVKPGGIRLEAADIQALKELQIAEAEAKNQEKEESC